MSIFSRRKILIQAIVLLTILNVILLVFSGWKYFKSEQETTPKPIDRAALGTMLTKELVLSKNQADSLMKLREAFFIKESQISKETRTKRDSMNLLMFSDVAQDSILIRLAAGVASNEYQMELLRIEQANQLKKLLTADQLRRLEKLVREIRDYLKPEDNRDVPKK